MMRLFLCTAFAASLVQAQQNQVWRCTVQASDVDALGEDLDLDVWKGHPGSVFDIMGTQQVLSNAPSLANAECKVHIADVEREIAEEAASREKSRLKKNAGFFDDYQRFDAIDEKLQELASGSNITTYVSSMGTSQEGRRMPGIVIDSGGSNKWTAYIGAGIHAREWISPATGMYVADFLVTQYGVDPEVTSILDRVNFHIFPQQNPDGYEFSHTNTRLWRKNRRPNGGGSYGVDLNRNFDWQWGGESNNPNSDTYQGPSAASEPETVAMQTYMKNLTNSIIAIDLHSYGNLILRSWGWTYAAHPNENVFLKDLGTYVRSAMIESGGQTYRSITGAELYPVTGAHDDWTSGNRVESGSDRKFVGHGWCLELRGNSFILSPDQIIPTGKEIVAGVKAYMVYLLDRFGDSP